MLKRARVLEIRRLLDEGELSQRKIALRVGVSRATIGAIASGKRALYASDDPPTDDADADPPETTRCRGCGALVTPPCVACAAVRFRERESRLGRRAA